ncbi:hypothetical protein KBB68_04260 [Candidatus Babeliales bacterium]|nr:hypothetical protein [Candidatus Babeliales bacterium]
MKNKKYNEPQIINVGKKRAVVLELELYEKMLETLEDAYLGKKSQEILKKGKFLDFAKTNKKVIKK